MALIAPTQEIVLDVRHDPQPDGLREVVARRGAGEKWGVSIVGGARSKPGNPNDKSDEGVFVSKVN